MAPSSRIGCLTSSLLAPTPPPFRPEPVAHTVAAPSCSVLRELALEPLLDVVDARLLRLSAGIWAGCHFQLPSRSIFYVDNVQCHLFLVVSLFPM
jgi:hypothetical protein